MFTFDFLYSDDKNVLIEHVVSALVSKSGHIIEIQGEDILKHNFDLKITCLKTSTGNCTISGDNLRAITITKN